MARHRVEQGETLHTIAHRYGLPGWTSLRDHPGNAELMAVRPDPQILFPGDELELPEPPEGIPVALDQRVQFRRRARNTQPLSLVLEHVDGTPMRDTAFTLEHDRDTVTGRTDGAGALALELPIEVRRAKLTAGAYEWEIDVGHLDPARDTDDDGASGCAGRLANLGWCHDPCIDDPEHDAARRALELFQLAHDLPQTGELDEATRARLERRHGC